MSDAGVWTTLAEAPALAAEAAAAEEGGPRFLAELTAAHRARVSELFPDRQWLRRDADGRVEAVVRAVELRWDGTTEAVPSGVGSVVGEATRSSADTLAVLDVTVAPGSRGCGRGSRVLAELDGLRAGAGLARLLVLVRPHAKATHPLVPFGRYVSAVDADGRPSDGWLAAAWEAGLHPARAVDRSLVARAPVAAWQRWYGRPFPTSGPYLLPGAIKPAIVEFEVDEGRYREPHLWMAPPDHLDQRTVDPATVREPRDAWRRALAAAGLVAGSRRHREVRRTR